MKKEKENMIYEWKKEEKNKTYEWKKNRVYE